MQHMLKILRKCNSKKDCTCSFLNRSFSSIKSDNDRNSVVVEERRNSRTVVLNRPHALNALSTPMGVRLTELYESWENDPSVNSVVIKGSGRAFCSGGDVVKLYHLINQGRVEECKDLFRTFYGFMHLLSTYSKPNVAILDGITMGGGAAIAIHGSHQVATENTVFGVPEILIGHHPDAGSSFYLSQLPGFLGEYLGLTAHKLSGLEMFACGLATHFLPTSKLQLMENQLGKNSCLKFSDMGEFLDKHVQLFPVNETSILHRMNLLNKCFRHATVEEIIDYLEREAGRTKDEWCKSALRKLKEAPPLSLKISLRSIREGRYETLEESLAREYRITLLTISTQISNNFCEGARTRLVDKSMAPKWDPPSLEQVSEDMVEAHFAPLAANEHDHLLPLKLPQASASFIS